MEKAIFRTLSLVLILLNVSGFSQNGESFTGTLLYHNISPMSDVNVYLHNSDGNVIQTTTTNASGNYTFENLTPGDYTVTFSSDNAAGGVSLSDAYAIMLHLFGMYPFDEIQELAADVDGSGNVTWTDYTFVLINYLTQGQQFPIGPWVFETVSFSTGSRTGNNTSGGSSSGDANGNFVPTKNGEYLVEENYIENNISAVDRELSMSVSSPNQILIGGMHLVINMSDGLTFTGIESPLGKIHYAIHGQQLTITWLDETLNGFALNNENSLLTIHASIDPSAWEKSSFSLDLMPQSHFIGINGEMLSGVQLTLPAVKLVTADNFTLNVFPNPFFDYATLDLQAAGEGKLTITLYDNSGRLVREIENSIVPDGQHSLVIDGTSLIPGTYFYNFRFEGADVFVKSGTIIKSR